MDVLGLTVDVRNPTEIQEMVEESSKMLRRIDIAVANAGMGFHKSPLDLKIDDWDENVQVNLRHTFVLAKEVFPHMKKLGGGKIITLGSMTSIFGIAFLPSYGASKGGVMQLTRSLAVAWARDNDQVNCILPGFINSGLSAETKKEVPEFEQAVINRTPAGRWGDPIDLAGTAVFLSSPASDFITGAAIPVDGGYSVQG